MRCFYFTSVAILHSKPQRASVSAHLLFSFVFSARISFCIHSLSNATNTPNEWISLTTNCVERSSPFRRVLAAYRRLRRHERNFRFVFCVPVNMKEHYFRHRKPSSPIPFRLLLFMIPISIYSSDKLSFMFSRIYSNPMVQIRTTSSSSSIQYYFQVVSLSIELSGSYCTWLSCKTLFSFYWIRGSFSQSMGWFSFFNHSRAQRWNRKSIPSRRYVRWIRMAFQLSNVYQSAPRH